MEYSARNTIIEKTWFVSLFFYSLASNDGDAGCFGQKCYKVYTSDDYITQKKAIEECHTLNGSLASIRGMQEQELLDAYLNANDDRGMNLYWIGAKRHDLNDWRWLDGTMYTGLSNLDISRLNEKTEPKPFAANIAKTNYKIEFHAISVYDPSGAPAEKFFALCQKQGCTRQGSSCYFLKQPAERWTTARNTCLNESADLATFPEELANDALALLQDEMFYSIGLTRVNWYWAKNKTAVDEDRASVTYEWETILVMTFWRNPRWWRPASLKKIPLLEAADIPWPLVSQQVKSDEVKYTNWDLHGPNSHCAALRREESGTTWRWSSYDCNSNSARGFVCEHAKLGVNQSCKRGNGSEVYVVMEVINISKAIVAVVAFFICVRLGSDGASYCPDRPIRCINESPISSMPCTMSNAIAGLQCLYSVITNESVVPKMGKHLHLENSSIFDNREDVIETWCKISLPRCNGMNPGEPKNMTVTTHMFRVQNSCWPFLNISWQIPTDASRYYLTGFFLNVTGYVQYPDQSRLRYFNLTAAQSSYPKTTFYYDCMIVRPGNVHRVALQSLPATFKGFSCPNINVAVINVPTTLGSGTLTTRPPATPIETTTNAGRSVARHDQIMTMVSTTKNNSYIEVNNPDFTNPVGEPDQVRCIDETLVYFLGAGVVVIVITLVVVIVILCWKMSTRRPPNPPSFNGRSQTGAYQARPDVYMVNELQYEMVNTGAREEYVPTAEVAEYANLSAASHGVSQLKKSVGAAVEHSATVAAGDGVVYEALARASEAPELTGSEYQLLSHQTVYTKLQIPSTGEQ